MTKEDRDIAIRCLKEIKEKAIRISEESFSQVIDMLNDTIGLLEMWCYISEQRLSEVNENED